MNTDEFNALRDEVSSDWEEVKRTGRACSSHSDEKSRLEAVVAMHCWSKASDALAAAIRERLRLPISDA